MTGLVSIPSRAGFLAARASGIKAVSAGFVLQAVPTGRDQWRLGLTASKKTGNAVRRNRARRRLRALARTELAARARAGNDYVIIARHGTVDRSWSDLTNDLNKALGYLHRQLDKGNLDKGNPDKGRSNGDQSNGAGAMGVAAHDAGSGNRSVTHGQMAAVSSAITADTGVDPGLQAVHFAVAGIELPAFANLFGICAGCDPDAWALARRLLCAKTYLALPPLGTASS